MNKGILFLIPCTIGSSPQVVIPSYTFEIINTIDIYVVENIRSARRFLSSLKIEKNIDDLIFHEIGKHTHDGDFPSFLSGINDGKNIGLISEAGLPAVADPGGKLVAIAHAKKITIKPLTGPSSLMLSLMSSGFNGQKFSFHGYIPKEKGERIRHLKFMENEAVKRGVSQIFMDTPFRNDHVLADCIEFLSPQTQLHISANLTTNDEFIKTQSISEWKKTKISLKKIPAVFIIGKLEYIF